MEKKKKHIVDGHPESCACISAKFSQCPIFSFLDNRFKATFSRIEVLEQMMKVTPAAAEKGGTAPGRKIRLDRSTIMRIRAKYKLTQTQFGLLLGTNLTSVNRWERGRTVPCQKMKERIIEIRSLGYRKVHRILDKKLQEETTQTL